MNIINIIIISKITCGSKRLIQTFDSKGCILARSFDSILLIHIWDPKI